MRVSTRRFVLGFIGMSMMVREGRAQQAPGDRKQSDSSTIAPDGTAYVTRVVPVPTTISPEAQKVLARVESDAAVPQTLEQRRTGTDKWQAGAGEESKKLYPVNVAADTIAGVPVRVVPPLTLPPENPGRVLINLHAAAFNSDSASLPDSIPTPNPPGTKEMPFPYRFAPTHPSPPPVPALV